MGRKTVAFIYGFTEGEWHGKRFRHLLREKGHEVVKDPLAADIIIAHSGGVFYVPKPLKNHQLLVIINPPYWPERPVTERARNMILHMMRSVYPGNGPLFQLYKTTWNFRYLIHHTKTNREMIARISTYDLENEISHPNTILVRNAHDPWLTPQLDGLKDINPVLRIHHLSGGHDDCWLRPETYINLIESVL